MSESLELASEGSFPLLNDSPRSCTLPSVLIFNPVRVLAYARRSTRRQEEELQQRVRAKKEPWVNHLRTAAPRF